ncbi:hypothetical protein EV697_10526 [Bisgaardia hudsonensis]|uniref:Outer membrane protein n=1 Tax=Bisgaardia hudsonensis TaxID=109472 RepID=A0A4R2MTQ4_9PAST|nr:hypothetical protein [Bisgaardia hudsonensis]QLB13584.1 hypothetical protein A6A11_08190 [Bisgaardia hudsonensis]TCP11914.1 hypothetical protein EV697_10526 [Bisgaardia hudsonensis]
MKLSKSLFIILSSISSITWANLDANIKYSSNYLMPAYVHFKVSETQYGINANINIPFYKIKFQAKGVQDSQHFKMISYKDIRNDNTYSVANINNNTIEYGKIKSGLKSEHLSVPTFDLFTIALQLSYYEKLPASFQITNGKKLYPMKNVVVNKSQKEIKYNKQQIVEVTYRFKTGEKSFIVKKHLNEQFPRYISYDKDGDHYELTFDQFVN